MVCKEVLFVGAKNKVLPGYILQPEKDLVIKTYTISFADHTAGGKYNYQHQERRNFHKPAKNKL